MRNKKMDTIQMRWFFRVIPSITYDCDEICERGTCDECGVCDDDQRRRLRLLT